MATNGPWLSDQEDHQTELAALAEWQRLQQRLLSFPCSATLQIVPSRRAALDTLLRQSTQARAHIHWQSSEIALPEAFDCWSNICWGKKRYGLLGLAPGYLASSLFPDIPQCLAQLLGLLLALTEYQTLAAQQLRRLPPATITDPLTPREQDILLSLIRGESEAEVAQRLGITPATAHSHRQRLYQ